jgi:hypothetical protein
MTLTPAEGRLIADTSVTLDRVRKGEVVDFVLGRHFTIESAEAHGASVSIGPTLTPWAGLQRIRLTFAEAQRAPKLRVRYAGKPSPGGEPPINMITPKLVELSLDGMWVPIRADLEGRFTADALISGLPRDATVVAQGRVSREGAAYRIRRDRPGVDLPLIAAPGLKRLAGGKFELLARDPDNEQARLYRKHAPAALAFLERWFGPVPGAPLRLVIVARERRSGYNRPGYVVFTETGKVEEAGTAKFTAHEFAHAWFSNANATTSIAGSTSRSPNMSRFVIWKVHSALPRAIRCWKPSGRRPARQSPSWAACAGTRSSTPRDRSCCSTWSGGWAVRPWTASSPKPPTKKQAGRSGSSPCCGPRAGRRPPAGSRSSFEAKAQ